MASPSTMKYDDAEDDPTEWWPSTANGLRVVGKGKGKNRADA